MADPFLLTDIFTPALAPPQFLALAVPQQQHLPAVPVPEPLFGQDTLPNPMPPGYMIPIAIYLDNTYAFHQIIILYNIGVCIHQLIIMVKHYVD